MKNLKNMVTRVTDMMKATLGVKVTGVNVLIKLAATVKVTEIITMQQAIDVTVGKMEDFINIKITEVSVMVTVITMEVIVIVTETKINIMIGVVSTDEVIMIVAMTNIVKMTIHHTGMVHLLPNGVTGLMVGAMVEASQIGLMTVVTDRKEILGMVLTGVMIDPIAITRRGL